jgi:hypothetical protein
MNKNESELRQIYIIPFEFTVKYSNDKRQQTNTKTERLL